MIGQIDSLDVGSLMFVNFHLIWIVLSFVFRIKVCGDNLPYCWACAILYECITECVYIYIEGS